MLKITGNEKAVVGGLTAGVLAVLGQVGVNGQLTLKEAVYAAVAWLVTHVIVFTTTNTPVYSNLIAPPVVVAPSVPVSSDATTSPV